jgi:dihydroflavonol-4-reductase
MTSTQLILVTGASGFVGKWTVVQLLQKGYRVRGTVRSIGSKGEQVRRAVASEAGDAALDRL